MNTGRLVFAASWALMAHLILLLLLWPQQVAPPQAADRSLPPVQVELRAPPMATPQTQAAAPSTAARAGAQDASKLAYLQRVRAHLAAMAPTRAINSGQAELWCRISSNGRVEAMQVRSASNAAVAADAEKLLRRAQPLPPPPEAMELLIPIRFRS